MPLADYDIGAAFEAIEDELIASMIRNMDFIALGKMTRESSGACGRQNS